MKKNKVLGIVSGLFNSILVISSALLIYFVSLLSGIETFYRVILCTILLCLTIMTSFKIIDSVRSNKTKKMIISIILSFVLSIIMLIISLLIFKVYNLIDNFSKDTLKYNTSLITFDENLTELKDIKNIKIGLLEDEENIEGYILPQEVIEKNKLEKNNEIIKYNDTVSLVKALYTEEVNAIFITSNYTDLFNSIEEYKDLGDKAKEIYTYGKNYKKTEIEEETSTIDVANEPITLLLLGVDSENDGLEANASFNGDTIMLVTFNPKTLNVTMFSIPRDTYVNMACGGNMTKINAASWGGSYCMVKTVEKFTGIKIDHYVKINFKGVVQLVDDLGGITVNVPVEFCEQNSDRLFGDKEICLKEGVQTLNGEQALALARHRKTLPLGDFQRGQNQQLIVEAILQSTKNVKSINDFYTILNNVSKNIDTSMSNNQMLSFYNLAKKLMFSNENNTVNIQKTYLTGYSLYVYEPANGAHTYSFHNWQGSLNDIVDAMKVNLELKEKNEIKTFSFSINTPYEKEIIGSKSYSESKRVLMPNFAGYTVDSAQNWANNNGVTLNINYVTNDNYFNGTIIDQSVPADSLAIKYPNVTITVVENKNSSNNNEENTTPEEESTESVEPTEEPTTEEEQ